MTIMKIEKPRDKEQKAYVHAPMIMGMEKDVLR